MQFLVSYDIAHPKRLRRVCRLLEGAGSRVQYSVFLCNMGSMRCMLTLWDVLQQQIDPSVDRLAAYPIDDAALAQALYAGAVLPCMTAEPLIVIA